MKRLTYRLVAYAPCWLIALTADKRKGRWWMRRKVYWKDMQEYVKKIAPSPPPLPPLQWPSRMLLLIPGYVASALGRAQGTPQQRNKQQLGLGVRC